MNKELFDPKYIRCTWDDSLKGKEVFYDDTVGGLEHEVQNLHHLAGKVVGHNVDDDDKPFVVEGICNALTNWRYVYYDPIYEFKLAHRDGKQVQFRSKVDGTWGNCGEEPAWDDGYEYRIKPDEQGTEKHVVPATEFPSLCGYCIHRKDGCTPEPAGNCINFFSTNDDYFRVKKDYVDLVKEHVELERKYGVLVSGIQQLMHGPVNC